MNKGHLWDILLILEVQVDLQFSTQDQELGWLCSLVMVSSEMRHDIKSRKQGSRPSSITGNFSGPQFPPLSSVDIFCTS